MKHKIVSPTSGRKAGFVHGFDRFIKSSFSNSGKRITEPDFIYKSERKRKLFIKEEKGNVIILVTGSGGDTGGNGIGNDPLNKILISVF